MKRDNENPEEEGSAKRAKATETAPSTSQKILKQVEFWFSDSNMPRDKFLKETSEKDDGWVPISVLMTFKRMQSLTTDPKEVVAACKDSTEVVVSEDETKVKRTRPLPADYDAKKRSVFVKHFPEEEAGKVDVDTITAFFAQYGTVCSVRLQRKQGVFQKRAIVEFQTQEDRDKIVALGTLTWPSGETLIVGQYGDGGKPREEKKNANNPRPQSNKQTAIIHGVLVWLSNVPLEQDRVGIKEYFSKFGEVRYVDSREKIVVRFKEPDGAKSCLAAIEAKTATLGDIVVEGELVTGEEEEKYWTEHILPYQQKKNNNNNRKDNRRGRK